MLVSKNAKICVTPDANAKICVTPNANRWNITLHVDSLWPSPVQRKAVGGAAENGGI